MRSKNSQLNEDFVYDLYYCVLKYESVCSVVVQYMDIKDLPNEHFQKIHKVIAAYYRQHKSVPSMGVVQQSESMGYGEMAILNELKDYSDITSVDGIIHTFGDFIKAARLRQAYREVGELYNKNEPEKAQQVMIKYAEWVSGFTLDDTHLVDVGATFSERFAANKKRTEEMAKSSLIHLGRFYIDSLDEMNQNRNLRRQLTCFLAATGVGKSHAARHIGASACRDGAHVLHFQLEGSEEEALDAYSGALVERSAYSYERGKFSDIEFNQLMAKVKSCSGSVTVRSFPRFNNHVSTIDIKKGISAYVKKYGRRPDIVIIDSLDLLTDSSGRKYDSNGERMKRVAAANDLKDLAADENVWMVVTYQATIENRDWLNDEKNVLTEFNCSEAKGLARPCTHLISLNQSDAERQEKLMRLYVAKSRFFRKGEPVKIAIDYDNEVFYDRPRSLRLNSEY